MARYIDADRLARKLRYIFGTYGVSGVIAEKVNKALNDSTAFKNEADFVEVVRCKDCEKCVSVDDRLICGNPKPSLLLKDFYLIGETRLAVVKPDDFCSYGQKK